MHKWRIQTRTKGSIPKSVFPSLLRQLCEKMEAQHLVSGFKGCGIIPLDREQVLKRLPALPSEDHPSILNEAVTGLLENHLFPAKAGDGKSARKRGPKVAPGAPVKPSDLEASHSGTDNPVPSTSGAQRKTRKRHVKQVLMQECSSDSSIDGGGDVTRKTREGPSTAKKGVITEPDCDECSEDDEEESTEACEICKKWNPPNRKSQLR